jgi:acetylornithine deacetylase
VQSVTGSEHTYDFRSAVRSLMPDVEEFLCGLIRCPSLSGQEAKAIDYAESQLAPFVHVERVPLDNSLRDDPDFSDPVPGIDYTGRANLRLRLAGAGGGRSLLFNTHLDVVPPSAGQPRPFDPFVENGVVFGRGACDAKGQAAVIYGVFALLRQMGVRLCGDVLAHLVVEEEVGGNGTLAMVRHGEQADACIVLEPTEDRILPSVRGAVWFRVTCTGNPGHSGRTGDTVSALKLATRVIEILERYHADLLASSRGIPLFDEFANPMPLTVGKLSAGNWPATAPASAVIEGVLGLLPNKTRHEVMREIQEAIASHGDTWVREHFKLEFMYRHDSHVLDPRHCLVRELQAACRRTGSPGEIAAMTASCDSWFYNNQLHIPTVVFGPGSLRFAHSDREQIDLDSIAAAIVTLADFACEWCNLEST